MPKPVNKIIQDKMIGHQVGLLRLSSGITNKLVTLLNKTEDDLLRQLSRLDNERTNVVLKNVREVLNAAKSGEYSMVKKELTDLAEYEPKYVQQVIKGALPVKFDMTMPSTDMLSSIVTSKPFEGKLLKEWIDDLSESRRRAIRDAVRMGMVEGQTVDQISKRIRGTLANKYKDGLMETSRRGVQAMVRTAVNHTATNARELMFVKNEELIKEVQIVATLDARTTPHCQAMDGRTFPVNSGPRPPFHINCRTVTVPVVKSFEELGFDIDEAPPGTRASMNGQVPDKTTYNEWLKDQPKAMQDSILGPTRADMFRKGVSVDKFVDINTGKHFTLKELGTMEGVGDVFISEAIIPQINEELSDQFFYHGTSVKDFDKFDIKKLRTGADIGGESWYGDGIYLSGESWKGSSYAYAGKGPSPRVLQTKTDVKNPFVIKGTGAGDRSRALDALGIPNDIDSTGLTNALKKKGYDSVLVLKNDSNVINELIVFDPSKIKITKKIPLSKFKAADFPDAKLPKTPIAEATAAKEAGEAVVETLKSKWKQVQEVYINKQTIENLKEVRRAKYAYMEVAPIEEYEAERMLHLKKITSNAKLTPGQIEQLRKGTEWCPLNLLEDIAEKGYRLEFTNKSTADAAMRATFLESRKIIRVAKNESAKVIGHEWSHVVDDLFGDGRGTGFKWKTDKYITEKELSELKSEFKALRSGKIGTYKNGDGEFFKNNWISDYEGRIYPKGGGIGEEWFAMNFERYTQYSIQLEKYDNLISNLKDTIAKYKDAYGEAQKRKLQKLIDEGREAYAGRLSDWTKAKQKYPKLTNFIETKFSKRIF